MSDLGETTLVASAVREAAESASDARVIIRALHDPEEMVAASLLLAAVWKLEPDRVHIDPGFLVALAHAGNYVSGAFRDDALVAACVGFFSDPRGVRLQSHIAGVAPELGGTGIGRALKLHQRAWCLGLGLTEIAWTFDPLIARNAYFNLHRLGAVAEEYLVDFYGDMTDGVNRGQGSDRLLVVWNLVRDTTGTAQAPAPDAALSVGDHGEPIRGAVFGKVCSVAIPADIESLRSADSELASHWRLALRDTLCALLGGGWRIINFDRSGRYILRKESP